MITWHSFFILGIISTILFSTSGTTIPYARDPRIFFFPVFPQSPAMPLPGFGGSFFDLPGQKCSSKNFFTGAIESGTCQKYSRCLLSGQRISGGCTLGLTTCCVPRHLLFTNAVPAASRTHIVTPLSRNYCQLRLDFEILKLEDPDVDGNCIAGKLKITGQKDASVNVPEICGENSGQHMYVNFNNGAPITIAITTSSSSSVWRIKATPILCGDKVNSVPSGCLQYYTGKTGSVKSFNYRDATPTGTNQLSNQNYKICLDTTTGATKVQWAKPTSVGAGVNYFFSLSGDATNAKSQNESPSTGTKECPSDYIVIRDGFYSIGVLGKFADRFCGLIFPANGITSLTNPFELQYITNSRETNDKNNNGFYLSYALTP